MIAYLEKHDPKQNMHRYYRLSITRTLFGHYALIREWGRCRTNCLPFHNRQRKEEWYISRTTAFDRLLKIALIKQQKGYLLIWQKQIITPFHF